MVHQRLHRRRKTGNGAHPEIVAVTEPAGNDDAIGISQRGLLVPDIMCRLAEYLGQDMITILVAVAAGKLEDTETHELKNEVCRHQPGSSLPTARAAVTVAAARRAGQSDVISNE